MEGDPPLDGAPPRSSSPPRDASAGAVLWTGDAPRGPVRLPEKDAAAFVAEFNRTYAPLGLAVRRSP